MRRTICLWLLVCLALGSAGPVPVPASQEELMEMILNAKPEDNDIAIQSERTQPSENEAEIESQVPVVTGDSDLQELASEQKEDDNNAAEEVQNVPEQDVEVEPEVELAPSSQETQHDDLPVLKEADILTQPQEPMPLTEVEFSNPEQPMEEFEQTEQIIPVFSDQGFPVAYYDENGNLVTEEEQIFFRPEVVEDAPFPGEEQLYGVPYEEEEIPVDEEEEIPVDEEEQFPLMSDEQIPYAEEPIPEMYYEEQPFDDIEFQPNPEEAIIVNFENEQIEEEPEELIVVDLEDEDGQPIYEVPMMPGFVAEVPQSDDISSEEDESMFGPFMTSAMEELPQTEIVYMDEESQPPVYFEVIDDEETDPEVFPVEMPDVLEMEVPADIPFEDMPPFEVSGMDGNPLTSEIPSGIVYPASPAYPYIENTQPIVDDSLGYYYISEDEVSEEELEDSLETSILVREVIGDSVPFINEPQVFGNDYFTPENIDTIPTLEVLEEADIGEELQESDFASDAMLNENVPSQYDVDQEETIFIIDPQALNDEETIIEIMPMEDNPPNPEPFPFGRPMLTDFIKTDPMNFEMPEEFQEFPMEERIEDIEDEDEGPIIIEDDSYLLPQQPIIFPEERPSRHNLPVFLDQWDEENYYQHPISGPLNAPIPVPSYFSEPSRPHVHLSDSSYYNPVPSQGPSYGNPFMHDHPYSPLNDFPSYLSNLPFQPPSFDSSSEESFSDDFPEDHFMMEPLEIMMGGHNDDFPSQMTNRPIMSPAEGPKMTIFVNEPLNMNDEDNSFPKTDVYDNFRLPSNPNEVDDFSSEDFSSEDFQQDFHGPNTFPLNVQQPDLTPDSDSYFNHDTPRYNENIPVSYASPQQFPMSDPSITPSSMSLSPSIFLSLIGQAGKKIRNPNRENMNMNLRAFDTPLTNSQSMNQRRQQQQYDVEVSYIPYETRYDFQERNAPAPFDYGYPSSNRPSPFYPVKGLPNDFQSYEEFFPYFQNSDRLYPAQSFQNGYNQNYYYRNRYADYHPYNYPTPTW